MSVTVLHGNCKDVMQRLLEEKVNVDSVVTDPPYELGFMGKEWDRTGIAYDKEMWELALQLLKPGGYLLSFGGSRTYHRMACAIEDAGFEIRDQIMWIYGTGFPKSLNIPKALDKIGAVEKAKEMDGWGTALKPAHEPIVVARKPLSEKTVAENVLKHGTGGINIDSSRVPYNGDVVSNWFNKKYRESVKSKVYGNGTGIPKEFDSSPDKGRFPANIVHDGSDEVMAEFAKYGDRKSGGGDKRGKIPNKYFTGFLNTTRDNTETKICMPTTGSAARFFYSMKASPKERIDGGGHPTTKPVSLMQYLVKLVTPTHGTVLDMFAGSGTTGIAALGEGMRAILIEKEQEYYDGILRRHAEHPTKT